ncbi:MAG: transposase, IS4 family [Candidatus Kentron sp. G]|nr:MAG: transposase, IS4 family [Candidatus Kentron sp. G]VFN03748.1 MAG: transposase, IS4 family [Candidatus Kentron sp. G]VFN04839.1 MAG: transposase, IS4 family [Candidatus Kentron sp. G]
MYVDYCKVRNKNKTYYRALLRESYRENGKVKKRNIANLGACSEEEVKAIRLALQHKGNLTTFDFINDNLKFLQGPSLGAVWLVNTIASRIGISEALGNSRQGKLALWQVIARVIDQGSRLSAVRLANNHGACDILDLEPFNEKHLYQNLDWLATNQHEIEKKLAYKLHGDKKVDLYLYDVTSSYLEGTKNQFAAFGYNRDKKRGKKQIVIGLLCDYNGVPISIEVFPGNTQDTATFGSQVAKVAGSFGGGTVTFVGDRGMIKMPQIEELQSFEQHQFHYITAITKPRIEILIKDGPVQLNLFDQELAEVQEENGIRYVLRGNPFRADQIKQGREEKFQSLSEFVDSKNDYLKNHQRAKVSTAKREIINKINEINIDEWVVLTEHDRSFNVSKNQTVLDETEKLDGCYVIKTDIEKDVATKELIHDRYKDLSRVEWAFRTSKTTHLEMRPLYVRLQQRTRGHAFVIMMAYRIVKELSSLWESVDATVEEGIKELDALCSSSVCIEGGKSFHRIPEPRMLSQQLLALADVTLPPVFPGKNVNVATKKKLAES